MTANAYTFLPWLRAGLTTRILADPGTAARASIDVELLVSGIPVAGNTPLVQPVTQPVQLYGPGDVVGVDARAITRTEPRAGVSNFEPNLLAHIEFADEDFPWRYSPATPDTARRLAPWLALVVLTRGADPAGADAEFTEAAQGSGPLPAITVHDPASLPRPDQLGAWAHVHVNGALADPVATDSTDAALAVLAEALRTDADSACARLICPRRLAPDTAYEAFLVPAFETGRLAGLGLDPALSPAALYSSWGPHYPNRPAEGELPYYHRWAFRTGTTGDFEALVRLLRPQPADPRVGRRDIDVHRSPGLGLPGITTPAELGGVLELGGALKVPDPPGSPVDPAENWDNWHQDPAGAPYPHPFEQALGGVINLADDYQRHPPAGGADPLITPPLYGRWHALTPRLLTGRDGAPIPSPTILNWVHRLNLDPRFRVAANFGTQVVQARQEELMAAAWEQVGDVLAANAKIRAAQVAREVGHALQVRHIDPPGGSTLAALAAAPTGRPLALTAPAHPRVTADDPFADTPARVALGFRVAASQVAAAPLSPQMRRITRPGSRLMRSLPFTNTLTRDGLLPRMDAATGAVTAAPPKATPGGMVTDEQVEAVLHPGVPADVDPVDQLPHSPDFVLRELDDPVAPAVGTADSAQAARFKAALHELYRGMAAAVAVGHTEPQRPQLLVAEATDAALTGLRADDTVPRTLLGGVGVPDRLRPFAEEFVEAMAYPVFDLPTYRPLLDQGVDAFVPNVTLVPANSVTLLANNREFIESYLVGLNHEMARELLWREYPTDQRGTPFRQFWDPRATLPLPGETPAQRRERTYDIPPIHTWPKDAFLGQNDNRQAGQPRQQDDLVLVIRGELLRKYPTAAIYAQRAEWPPGADGGPDLTQPRQPVTLPDDAIPGPDQVRLPLYEAKIEPDVFLLGFDLDADQARGNPPTDAGWFFMIKERPGDPRFGVDDGTPTNLEVWNDLTWDDVDPHRLGFLELDPTVSVPLQPFDGSRDDPEKRDQRAEDESLPLWFAGLSSADLAYILFQVPVLVAVHAQEMLPR